MSGLIPFVRRSTLHDWVYDIDKFFEPVSAGQKSLSLAVDIEESEHHIVMGFDIPGLKQGDFNLKVENNKLILTGERKRETREANERKRETQETGGESANETYANYGRQYGPFFKTFALPQSVDQSKIEADYHDGVLKITLPKLAKEKPQAVEVKIRGF